jgi:hypothetical protein
MNSKQEQKVIVDLIDKIIKRCLTSANYRKFIDDVWDRTKLHSYIKFRRLLMNRATKKVMTCLKIMSRRSSQDLITS